MTDSSPTRPSPAPAHPSGRAELERALAGGVRAFRLQLRYVLALAQLARAKTAPLMQLPMPPSLTQARYEALSRVVDSLTTPQALTLLRSLAKVSDAPTRLPLAAQLARQLPAHDARRLAQELIQQSAQADTRTRALMWFELALLVRRIGSAPNQASPLMRLLIEANAIKHLEARLRALVAICVRLPQESALSTLHHALDELLASKQDALIAKGLEVIAPHALPDLQTRLLSAASALDSPDERARATIALAHTLTGELQEQARYAALSAIDRIESDEERADALVSFAPCLETVSTGDPYPEILERALTSAILIGRRSARARVLVSLAPHLTPDLQGEALAAVHSLPNERERAILLAQLAPTLPANMLVASLAVAHTMREQDSRVHALSVLAHYVPVTARAQTLLDALAAASNLPHHFERVRALAGLMESLPDKLREQAITNALETARLIDNDNARARALNLLGVHLPPRLQERALSIANELDNLELRLNALLGLAPYLPPTLRASAALDLLDCAAGQTLEYKRARALISIIPHLPTDSLVEVEKLADALSEPIDRLNVWVSIAQHSPPERRPPLILKAWSASKQIEDGYDRANALSALAPFLPASARKDMNSAIFSALKQIEDEYDRASAFALLVPLVSESDAARKSDLPDASEALWRGMEAALSCAHVRERAELLGRGALLYVGLGETASFQAWARLAQRLALMSLNEAVLCLGALVPLVREMAGEAGVRELATMLGAR